MTKRKRGREPAKTCGEQNGRAKLSSRKVIRARALHSTGLISLGELGKVFGVRYVCIARAINRETWAHIK